jgi:hypothetical protein
MCRAGAAVAGCVGTCAAAPPEARLLARRVGGSAAAARTVLDDFAAGSLEAVTCAAFPDGIVVDDRTGDRVAIGIAAASKGGAGGEARAFRFAGAWGVGETAATCSGESKTEVSEPDEMTTCCGSGEGDTGPGFVSTSTSRAAGTSFMIAEIEAAHREHW